MSEIIKLIKEYLSNKSKVNISVFRIECLLLIATSTLIQYVAWNAYRNNDIIFPNMPTLFLFLCEYDDLNTKLYQITFFTVILICIIKVLIICGEVENSERALLYTVEDIVKILYGIHCFRYALSVCIIYKNNNIQELDQYTIWVTFIYLFIYKIGGYIYESWLTIINHSFFDSCVCG